MITYVFIPDRDDRHWVETHRDTLAWIKETWPDIVEGQTPDDDHGLTPSQSDGEWGCWAAHAGWTFWFRDPNQGMLFKLAWGGQ